MPFFLSPGGKFHSNKECWWWALEITSLLVVCFSWQFPGRVLKQKIKFCHDVAKVAMTHKTI